MKEIKTNNYLKKFAQGLPGDPSLPPGVSYSDPHINPDESPSNKGSDIFTVVIDNQECQAHADYEMITYSNETEINVNVNQITDEFGDDATDKDNWNGIPYANLAEKQIKQILYENNF